MTQTLKKMMLLAFVFAIASAAPKMTFSQEISSLDAKLRPHFTIRTDKGFKGGLSGAKGLIAMLALNRMVANNSTGFTAVKDAVVGIRGTFSDYGSGVMDASDSSVLKKVLAKFHAALVSPVVTGLKGTAGFAAGFVTDMNPFGSYEVVTNQKEIAARLAEREAALRDIPEIEATADNADAVAERLAARTAALRDLPEIEVTADNTEAVEARVAERTAVLARLDEIVPAQSTKRMLIHKQVAGQGSYAVGNAPAFFSLEDGKADKGRSLMAYMTIASALYTVANSYRDYRDAKAAAEKRAKEAATLVDAA
jgi:hypothetical protein